MRLESLGRLPQPHFSCLTREPGTDSVRKSATPEAQGDEESVEEVEQEDKGPKGDGDGGSMEGDEAEKRAWTMVMRNGSRDWGQAVRKTNGSR